MDRGDIERNAGSLVALAPEHPITVHLSPGATVTAIAGTVWLTQEGMIEDIVLRPGQQFVVPAKGAQVLSAVDASALVRIADVHAQARALRRAELRRLFQRARSFLGRSLTGAGAPSSSGG